MGPRFFKRGETVFRHPEERQDIASMGPRFFKRGECASYIALFCWYFTLLLREAVTLSLFSWCDRTGLREELIVSSIISSVFVSARGGG